MSGKYALGWIPDYPDFRDFTEETEEVREILMSTGLPFRSAEKKARPAKTLHAPKWTRFAYLPPQPSNALQRASAPMLSSELRKAPGEP